MENIQFGASRRDLTAAVISFGGHAPLSLKVIRHGSASDSPYGLGARRCSAIAEYASRQEMEDAITGLNAASPIALQHILAQGSFSLRAKEAYVEGTRSIAIAKATSHVLQSTKASSKAAPVPKPPSTPPPSHLCANVVSILVCIHVKFVLEKYSDSVLEELVWHERERHDISMQMLCRK